MPWAYRDNLRICYLESQSLPSHAASIPTSFAPFTSLVSAPEEVEDTALLGQPEGPLSEAEGGDRGTGGMGGQVHLELRGPGPWLLPGGQGCGREAWSHLTHVPHKLLAPVPHTCHVSILPTRRREQQDAV